MKIACAAARPWSVTVAGILVGIVVLAGAPTSMTAAAPSPPLRLTLVSHAWIDEDFTPIDDAWFGLTRFKAIAGSRVSIRWIPLNRSDPANIVARKYDYADALRLLRDAAASSDVIIAWGDMLTGPVLAIAREYPQVRFGLISSVYVARLPANVVEGTFREEEEAFLAGALAAMISRSRIVAYIGPHESTPRRIGFEAGVYYANPVARVIADNVGFPAIFAQDDEAHVASWIAEGSFEPSLHDARKAEEIALSQYDRGADVIYVAAGGSNAGAYEAAALRRRWVIGSGGQRTEGTLPARWQKQVLAVVSDHPERVTYHLASHLAAGQLEPRHVVWGLTYPGAPVIVIDYTTRKQQFDRVRPNALALIKEIGLHRVKVPFNQPQLADFMKEFPR